MPKPTPLCGEIAIVTGASSGIGACTARELAARGATVILAARRVRHLGDEVRAITRAGGRALAIPTDLTDPRQIANLTHEANASCGRVDILVNSAGVGMPGPIARLTIEQILDQIATNLVGPILLTRALLPGMLARRHGVVISVASLASHVPIDPLYSATKFGLRGFSLALCRQLHGSGVTASMVSPGFIRTAMTSEMRQKLPGPDYVARAIAGLVLTPRRQVIVPPHYYLDIWTERLIPWVMERILRRRMCERDGTTNSMLGMTEIERIASPAPPPRNEPLEPDAEISRSDSESREGDERPRS